MLCYSFAHQFLEQLPDLPLHLNTHGRPTPVYRLLVVLHSNPAAFAFYSDWGWARWLRPDILKFLQQVI